MGPAGSIARGAPGQAGHGRVSRGTASPGGSGRALPGPGTQLLGRSPAPAPARWAARPRPQPRPTGTPLRGRVLLEKPRPQSRVPRATAHAPSTCRCRAPPRSLFTPRGAARRPMASARPVPPLGRVRSGSRPRPSVRPPPAARCRAPHTLLAARQPAGACSRAGSARRR